MRRFVTGPLLGMALIIGLLAVTTTTVSADPRDFTLVNGSDVTITHIYVSSTHVSSWEDDILGVEVLAPGESVDITFSGDMSDSCAYDIKVIATGGEGYLWGVDLCSTTSVTFR